MLAVLLNLDFAASALTPPAGPATAQYQTMLTWIGRCIGVWWLYEVLKALRG